MSIESVIGATIGFFIGGPTGAQIGWTIGSYVGAEGTDTQGPRLGDLKVQSSSYGKDIPIVYGSARMAGNVIWALPLRETETEEDQGKGGGGSTVTTYTYDATFAVLLCEGPITGIRKIWAFGELIYNLSDDASLETIIASNRAARSFTIYTGSETQEADPLIQADLGAANTQAFRGYAYVVFNRLQLEKYGNRIPELTFEVVGAGSSALRLVQSQEINSATGGDFTTSAPFWDYDNGFYYVFEGDWTTTYLTNNVTIYKRFFNGSIDRMAAFSVYGGAIAPSARNPAYTYSRDGAYQVYAYGFPTGQGRLYFYSGLNGGSAVSYNFIAGSSSGGGVYCVYEGFLYGLMISSLGVTLEKGSIAAMAAYDGVDFGLTLTIINSESEDLGNDSIVHQIDVIDDLIYILNANNTIQIFDLDGNLQNTISFSPSPSISYLQNGFGDPHIKVDGNVIHIFGNTRIFSLNTDGSNLTYHGNPSSVSGDGYTSSVARDFRDGIYYEYEPLGGAGTFNAYAINSTSSNGVALSTIQSDICDRAGLAASDINVTALTDTVTGYVIPRNMSGRAASEQLMKAYFYDPADINNKITFVKRGGASVATITENDLGAHYYGSDFETITHERLQDPELPSEIVVKHIDQNRAYQDGAQRSQRITHPVENISTTELSIVMTATKAKQTTEIWMQNAYTERDKYQFALSRDYIDLNPTDVITVPTGGGNRDLRITKITYAPVMDIEAVADSPYTSAAVAGEGEVIGGVIGLQGPTNLRLLDIPLLRNADNDEGIYLAASGYYDAWTGGQVFTSNNETDGYTAKTSIFNDAVMGSATTALADASMYDWDRTNTVTIQLTNGDLSSITEDQVSQGNNYCILGDEIIQYANATLNANGTYTLDTLTRGRRGTDWATSTHAIGDRFIFIGALTLKRIEHAYNALKYYKAATFGSFLDEADTQSLTNTGVSLKPFSPVDVKGSRDGSNNLTITWQRRSRYIAPTFRDLPLFEGSESYEVDVMSGATVLRTIAVTAETASYTAAQQTADGLTPGNSVTVRVYQLSAIVGRGYKREAVI